MTKSKEFSSKGSVRTNVLVWTILGVFVIAGGVYWFFNSGTPTQSTTPTGVVTNTPPANTYGMSQYNDPAYGFSFWYPSALQVTSTTTNDNVDFPGGIAVETLQIGSMGGTSIVVVDSPISSITDEPANHASPISQTEYFYSSGQWMVSYPQGRDGQGSSTTTVADTSRTTMSGLFMLPSGKRFDTTIIPVSTTEFLVISDGGGSSFTSQLAETVSQAGSSVPASLETSALQAEASAYAQQ